jgi:hypothetical protein
MGDLGISRAGDGGSHVIVEADETQALKAVDGIDVMTGRHEVR